MVKNVVLAVTGTAAGMIGAALGFGAGEALGRTVAGVSIVKAGLEPTQTWYNRTGFGPFGKKYRVDYKPVSGTGKITRISGKDYKAAVKASKNA